MFVSTVTVSTSVGSSKLTVAVLNSSLKQLVKWQHVATYLTEIEQSTIQIIERNHKNDVDDQKLELCREWLRVYPHATWEDVVEALCKANENSIAENIKEIYLSKSNVQNSASGSEEHPTVISTLESLPPHEATIEKEVLTDLKEQHESFGDLASDVEKKCKTLISSGKLDLTDLTTRLKQEEDVYMISGIAEIKTSQELFAVISKSWNFLDCELLKILAKEIPDDNVLLSRVKGHVKKLAVL